MRNPCKIWQRRGTAMVYAMIMMTALFGFCSLATDYGRVRLAKTQLQGAADAAALYGIRGLKTDIATAQSQAIAAAADNKCNNATVVLTNNDIEFGLWNSTTRTFTVLTGNARQSATAIRITARAQAARGSAIGTPFAAVIGRSQCDVTAQAVAIIGKDVDIDIPATSCPWLAGMPNGTKISGAGNGVSAPTHSPVQVQGITVAAGQKLKFRNTTGTTGDTSSGNTYGLDGDPTRTTIKQASVNGINSTTAPLNALVGIFLNDNAPNTTAAAATLDFSSTSSRNFTTLSPGLKQVFFIGDGVNSDNYLQDFTVPNGATRLFLGVMDENAFWWDNVGTIQTTMFAGNCYLVK